MRALIQRVNSSNVKVDGNIVGSIGKGFLIFLGVGKEDSEKEADKLLAKILKLRIFEDENGKINYNLAQINGEMLVISQFTLYARVKGQNRPGFTDAAEPKVANDLYEYFINEAEKSVSKLGHGIFGADMKVCLENDGPFTIWLDTDEF